MQTPALTLTPTVTVTVTITHTLTLTLTADHKPNPQLLHGIPVVIMDASGHRLARAHTLLHARLGLPVLDSSIPARPLVKVLPFKSLLSLTLPPKAQGDSLGWRAMQLATFTLDQTTLARYA